jgi:hypothetical protein
VFGQTFNVNKDIANIGGIREKTPNYLTAKSLNVVFEK